MLAIILMAVTKVPLRNADVAAAEAAGLVWGHLARQVEGPTATASKLARALAPVYGVTWNRAAITADAFGGTDNINRVCCLMRNSPLIRSECDRLAALLKEAYTDASLSPPEMGDWRATAQRRRQEMHFHWGRILAVCAQLAAAGFPRPPSLSAVGLSELHAVAMKSPAPPPPPMFSGCLVLCASRLVGHFLCGRIPGRRP